MPVSIAVHRVVHFAVAIVVCRHRFILWQTSPFGRSHSSVR